MANGMFDRGKMDLKFYEKNSFKNFFLNKIPPKFYQVDSMTRGGIPTKFCSDWMSRSYFIVGTIKFCPASVAWWPWPKIPKIGAKNFPHTHRLTMCDLKKLASGFSRKVEKCWQNGGGGGKGPKTLSPPVTQGDLTMNRMAWQWAETLVEIRGTLADIRGTTKLGIRYHFPKHEFNRPVCLETHHYLLAHLSQ